MQWLKSGLKLRCLHTHATATAAPYQGSTSGDGYPWLVLCFQGTSVSNNQVFNVVDCVLRENLVPYATNAIYLVLGASNIQVTSGESPCTCWERNPAASFDHPTPLGLYSAVLIMPYTCGFPICSGPVASCLVRCGHAGAE